MNKPPITNRIPQFTGDVVTWAMEMDRLGLAYHIDDDPADIETRGSISTFTAYEAEVLRSITNSFTEEQREQYFDTILNRVHEANGEPITIPASQVQEGDQIERFGHFHPVVKVGRWVHPLIQREVVKITHDIAAFSVLPEQKVTILRAK